MKNKFNLFAGSIWLLMAGAVIAANGVSRLETLSVDQIVARSLTASRALVLDASKNHAASTTTATQLALLDIATGRTGTGNVCYSDAANVTGNWTFDTTTLVIDASNDRVCVGCTSPAFPLDVRRSFAGTQVARVANTDTGASSHAEVLIRTQDGSSGDPRTGYDNNVTNWVTGMDNSDSDKFKLSRSATLGTNDIWEATASNFTSLVQFLAKGTATNDNAAAGYIGEAVRSQVGATSFPATGQYGDLTSISLTAGDWDVSILGKLAVNGATSWNWVRLGISTTSGNSSTGLTSGDNQIEVPAATSTADNSAGISSYRMSLTGTTTVYFKYQSSYSSGPPTLAGRISARRPR